MDSRQLGEEENKAAQYKQGHVLQKSGANIKHPGFHYQLYPMQG